ncbi:hypothetical protein CGRA01v4_06411 [Colletotrichum graminicola]|nr:hypothetical protein CGRA01v4_06411 [Colletotrichum graminicola]
MAIYLACRLPDDLIARTAAPRWLQHLCCCLTVPGRTVVWLSTCLCTSEKRRMNLVVAAKALSVSVLRPRAALSRGTPRSILRDTRIVRQGSAQITVVLPGFFTYFLFFPSFFSISFFHVHSVIRALQTGGGGGEGVKTKQSLKEKCPGTQAKGRAGSTTVSLAHT